MKKLFLIFVINITFIYNLSAQLERPRCDGDLRKYTLFVINGVVIPEKEGNPLTYLAAYQIERMKILYINDDENISGICFVKTHKNIRLHKKIRKMIKNAGKSEYVIFGEKNN